MTRTHARASKQKQNQVRKIDFFTSYNPSLTCMNTLIERHLPLLHSDDKLKTLFPTETFNVVYGRNKYLKELLKASLFLIPGEENTVVLLVVTRDASVKGTWSLAVHLLVLLLVRNITSEVILQVILLMSFI